MALPAQWPEPWKAQAVRPGPSAGQREGSRRCAREGRTPSGWLKKSVRGRDLLCTQRREETGRTSPEFGVALAAYPAWPVHSEDRGPFFEKPAKKPTPRVVQQLDEWWR